MSTLSSSNPAEGSVETSLSRLREQGGWFARAFGGFQQFPLDTHASRKWHPQCRSVGVAPAGLKALGAGGAGPLRVKAGTSRAPSREKQIPDQLKMTPNTIAQYLNTRSGWNASTIYITGSV